MQNRGLEVDGSRARRSGEADSKLTSVHGRHFSKSSCRSAAFIRAALAPASGDTGRGKNPVSGMRPIWLVACLAQFLAACGEDCSSPCSGTCTAGRCLTTLASTQDGPSSIALDGQNVYWSNALPGAGAILKAPLNGGSATTLAASLGSPRSIAIDSHYLYWVDEDKGTLSKVSLDGGTPEVLTSGFKAPRVVAVAGDVLDVFDAVTNTVNSVPREGGTPTVIGSDVTTRGVPMAVDGTNVYWLVDQSPTMTPIDGGAATDLVSLGSPVYGDSIYWIDCPCQRGTEIVTTSCPKAKSHAPSSLGRLDSGDCNRWQLWK